VRGNGNSSAWMSDAGRDHAGAGTDAGGAAASHAGALAAGVVRALALAAADGWVNGPGVAAQAASLRRRLTRLAVEDADAYAAARAARGRGDHALGAALDRAAALPLEIARTAADVVSLAAEVALRGDPGRRADAAAAALLADAAARVGALLVEANLATAPGDERLAQAHAACEAAAAAASRAVGHESSVRHASGPGPAAGASW